ncbi:hypothetical protein ACIBEH_32675 [Nocardia salmonicida]|uniref:hypothetical protein n=1 Tax=Nocardia salmonicida TaxID=53431 RepID=UPI00379C924B
MNTTIVELHVIARLDDGDCAADLFGVESYYDAVDGSETGRVVTGFWESVILDSETAGLDELDAALTGAGYQRTGAWRKRVTAARVVRYFTDATIHICE